jgi:hypothetical protein
MSLNSLKIATDGYLKKSTKAVLIIAVAGYLNFGGSPIDNQSGDGFRKPRTEQREDWNKRIMIEDDEILAFIKIFMECQG